MSGPRIVCVGGGHGLSVALGAVRSLTDRVTAVVTVSDDGGSSGVLRRALGIPAPGDLRMAICALAEDPSRAALLQYRFRQRRPDERAAAMRELEAYEGELAGHPLGNLLVAALADLHGDFARAVEETASLAGVCGRVLPVTVDLVTLAAITGGHEVRGQVAVAGTAGPVERLWLEPSDPRANPAALEEIERADLVVLGPGSLFTSVVAALLVPGILAAIGGAGRVALVLNLTQQMGETIGLDGAAHVRALLAHCPGLRLDAVLAHDGPLRSVAPPVTLEDDAFAAQRAPLVRADLAGAGPAHDPAKLAATLKALLL